MMPLIASGLDETSSAGIPPTVLQSEMLMCPPCQTRLIIAGKSRVMLRSRHIVQKVLRAAEWGKRVQLAIPNQRYCEFPTEMISPTW